ncbi:MAG: leucine-rich repeat domain-containing protein [Armatimonadetes bacterium]|nr:leucine-rich repeat domain-containing protein [Armatimonadota bacterium]
MGDVRLDGIEVCASWLTQRSFRAAHCSFLLPVTPANKEEALAEFRRAGELGKYSGLRVSGIADLSFLKGFPRLLYLEVVNQERVDTRQLDGLTNLRGLRLESPGAGIDFARFPLLEVFVGDWRPDNRNIHRSRELRQIRAWHFRPRSLDLADLAGATRLEWLELTQTNIASLSGVETLADLRYLHVSYAPQLQALDALAAGHSGIRELGLGNARRVPSYLPIASLGHLRRLQLSSCAPMPDLKWTRGMDSLDFFSFVQTDVQDGDLSPLLSLPRLAYVGTMDKRHYNYKCDRLNELLQGRRAFSGPSVPTGQIEGAGGTADNRSELALSWRGAWLEAPLLAARPRGRSPWVSTAAA